MWRAAEPGSDALGGDEDTDHRQTPDRICVAMVISTFTAMLSAGFLLADITSTLRFLYRPRGGAAAVVAMILYKCKYISAQVYKMHPGYVRKSITEIIRRAITGEIM